MGLEEVEPEVLHLILEYVNDTSPVTVSRSLVLVNKHMNQATEIVLYRRKTFVLAESVQLACAKNRWCSSEALEHVRYLTIEASRRQPWEDQPDFADPTSYAGFTQRFEPFNDFIRSIRNLKSLTWNAGPIPHTLLRTLQASHPKAILKAFNYTRFDADLGYLDPSEAALCTFPNLTHLRFAATGLLPLHRRHVQTSGAHSYETFKTIVKSANRLEYAGFICSLPIHLEERQASSWQASGQDGEVCTSLRNVTLDGASLVLSKATLEDMSRWCDVSRLETLKFSRGLTELDYFLFATTMLPNIQQVSLNLNALLSSSQAGKDKILSSAKSYLTTCQPLSHLSLWGWTQVCTLEELFNRHGPTLVALQLHEKEMPDVLMSHPDAHQRFAIDFAAVQSIRRACPRVRELTIDVNRENGTFNTNAQPEFCKILNELSLFRPQLRKTQLYVDSHGLAEHLFGFLDHNDDQHYVPSDSEEEDDGVNEEVAEEDTEEGTEVEDSEHGEFEGEYEWDLREQTGNAIQPVVVLPLHSQTGSDDAPQLATISSPPRKRPKTDGYDAPDSQQDEPDPEQILLGYVESIWKRVYATATTGERLMDVKFGEWESNLGVSYPEEDPRRYFEVKPHERDDKIGECNIKTRRKS